MLCISICLILLSVRWKAEQEEEGEEEGKSFVVGANIVNRSILMQLGLLNLSCVCVCVLSHSH